jgi:hypothetical protein
MLTCRHSWHMAREGDDNEFYFGCRRCRAMVSLRVTAGVLHANVHGELGPIISSVEVQQLVESVVAQFMGRVGRSKKRHRRAG